MTHEGRRGRVQFSRIRKSPFVSSQIPLQDLIQIPLASDHVVVCTATRHRTPCIGGSQARTRFNGTYVGPSLRGHRSLHKRTRDRSLPPTDLSLALMSDVGAIATFGCRHLIHETNVATITSHYQSIKAQGPVGLAYMPPCKHLG